MKAQKIVWTKGIVLMCSNTSQYLVIEGAGEHINPDALDKSPAHFRASVS